MKAWKCIVMALAIVPIISFAQPSEELKTYKVPFTDVLISEGQSIKVNYGFEPDHQMLECQSYGAAMTYVEWTYQNKKDSNVIEANGAQRFKASEQAPGEWVDPVGSLKVSNVTTAERKILFSCYYSGVSIHHP